ncbi:SusC/RagA family TonB-linked outer membrane protein [Echinicola sediminis]
MILQIRNKFRFLTVLCLVLMLGLFTGKQAAFAVNPSYSLGMEEKKVSGKVVNADSEALMGITVTSVNTQEEVETDRLGNFTITVSGDDDSLTIEGEAYISQTVSVEDLAGAPFISLVSSKTQKTDLVWGELPSEYTTEARSSIGMEEVRQSPVANLSNALAGRLPGLVSVQGTGEPGYDGASLYIRGLSTFGNNSVKVFVDGYERQFGQFDPNEIESITVLKDAAANAMFGIFGANKVLMVKTKRGQANQTRINFNTEFGFQSPIDLPEYLDSYQYATLYNEALRNDGLPERFNPEAIEAYRTGSNPWLYPNVNWHDEILKDKSMQQRHNFNISGGNETARYFVSLGMLDQKGLYKYTDLNDGYSTDANYTRYNFRSNIDVNLNPKTAIKLDLAGRLENRNFPGSGASTIFNNLSGYPPGLFPMLNEDGSIGGNAEYGDNPYGLITNTGFVENRSNFFLGTVEATRKLDEFIKGLKFHVGFTMDSYYDQLVSQSKDFAVYQLNQDGTYTQFGNDEPLSGRSQGQAQNSRVGVKTGFDYNRTFGADHEVMANLVYYQSKYTVNNTPDPYATQLVALRGTYVNKGKYIGQLSMSYSGSENFAPGERFGFFPTVSAGWIASKEEFLKNSSVIDYLKVRGSFGLLGNDQIGGGRFPYLSRYTGGGTVLFGNQQNVGTRREGNLPNLGATWEKAKMGNFGFDLALVDNHLNISVDAFYERREDILSQLNTIPDLMGAILPASNVGIATNKGFEWDVTWNNTTGDLSYFVRALGSLNKSNIVYQDEPFRENEWEYRRGNPINQGFGLTAIGFFEDEADIANSPLQTYGSVKPGDIKYKDLNGDDIIDYRDESAIGKPTLPQLYYGGQIGLSFKGFDISALVQGAGARGAFILNRATMGFAGNAKPTEFVLNRWTPETADTADYPRLSAGDFSNNYRNSTFWLRDVKYLRLKNIELGYTLPGQLTERIGVYKARIYANGYNLLTFDDLDFDPENIQSGISSYPIMKTVSLGVRVSL